MTDSNLQDHVTSRASSKVILEDEDLIRISLFHYLRGCGFENLARLESPPTEVSVASTTHSVQSSAHLRLLISDARTSIVLALQRHWNNEQYRPRLRAEQHYRVLQPYLSEQFRRLMVRASHSASFRWTLGREPNLAVKYQVEIDRLEREWKTSHVI